MTSCLCVSIILCPESSSVLTAIFPGEPGLAGFIGAKDDGSGGNNWSYKMCILQSQTNTHLGCPSCHQIDKTKISIVNSH